MSTLLAVTLRGMQFHALVGILAHERTLPQPLEVDLTAWVQADPDTPAPVDYRVLYDLTAGLVQQGTGHLEELAMALADATLALPAVRRTAVAVRKPHVPLPGPLAWAEVRLERARGE